MPFSNGFYNEENCIKGTKMSWPCVSLIEEMRNAYTILVYKRNVKKTVENSNIISYLREIRCEGSGTRYGPIAGFCEHIMNIRTN
jgi:hypothetical protein